MSSVSCVSVLVSRVVCAPSCDSIACASADSSASGSAAALFWPPARDAGPPPPPPPLLLPPPETCSVGSDAFQYSAASKPGLRKSCRKASATWADRGCGGCCCCCRLC